MMEIGRKHKILFKEGKCRWGLPAAVCLLVILTAACGRNTETEAVGNGWVPGEDIVDEQSTGAQATRSSDETVSEASNEEETQPSSGDAASAGCTIVDRIPFNTDPPGTGLELSFEFISPDGLNRILKLTNHSDVCYSAVYYDYWLNGIQLRGKRGRHALIPTIPAHSTVYMVADILIGRGVFDVPVVTEKDWGTPGAIECGIVDYEVSENLIQDASDYIDITENGLQADGQIAVFENHTNRSIYFNTILIVDDTEVFNDSLGFSYSGLEYRNADGGTFYDDACLVPYDTTCDEGYSFDIFYDLNGENEGNPIPVYLSAEEIGKLQGDGHTFRILTNSWFYDLKESGD